MNEKELLEWIMAEIIEEMQVLYQPPKTLTGLTPEESDRKAAIFMKSICRSIMETTHDKGLVRKAWVNLQRRHKGIYYPLPQEFVEAIAEARKERSETTSAPALPPPPKGDRDEYEIEKIMHKIVLESPIAKQIVREGLVSFLIDKVKKQEVNGPQDVDQRCFGILKAEYQKFVSAIDQANSGKDGSISKTLIRMAEGFEAKMKRSTEKYLVLISDKEVA